MNNTLEKEHAECLPKKHAPVAHHAAQGAGVSRGQQSALSSNAGGKSTPTTANFSFPRRAVAMAAGLALPPGLKAGLRRVRLG
jgi:hypothetical protein